MRIAIVGAGISGLVAAYLLDRRHEVRVFEAAQHAGGHTFTFEVEEERGSGVDRDADRKVSVDMGFIVYNDRTYPNFCRLLDELGVETQESDMSFGVRNDRTGLEYCGSSSLNQLFAQRSNLVRPSFYRMISGIFKFHRRASELSDDERAMSLGEFLERERLPTPFVESYLVPMISAIWSTDPSRIFDFPLRTLVSFLDNHGMLQVRDRPQWRVVKGGSQRYVEKLTAKLANGVETGTPVSSVKRRGHNVEVKLQDGPLEAFDAVVFATHSDRTLEILGDATDLEREVLKAIPYQANDVVLHTDRNLMPRRRLAWASWNYYLGAGRRGGGRAPQTAGPAGSTVTYWMNRLQSLESETDYLVTLNRTGDIDPSKILHRTMMDHPLFLEAGEAAKSRWADVSRDRTYFCGAYWGYGFHEDGVKSGLRVAAALGESW